MVGDDAVEGGQEGADRVLTAVHDIIKQSRYGMEDACRAEKMHIPHSSHHELAYTQASEAQPPMRLCFGSPPLLRGLAIRSPIVEARQ